MGKELQQIVWGDGLQQDWLPILELAIGEDIAEQDAWTTNALVPSDAVGRAVVVARRNGTVAGLPGVEPTLHAIDPQLGWSPSIDDGQAVASGDPIGVIDGPVREILAAERLVLNLLGRLSGIATLTRAYVDAVGGAKVAIYDTRKTTPGWRRLEKYAVRCGGGRNHRGGLFKAVLIKDNHLAWGAEASAEASAHYTPREAVVHCRRFVERIMSTSFAEAMIIEIEVDRLDQLDEVLTAGPDIVLLNNMSPTELREAVARRDAHNPTIELEASGGISLETIAQIAETGVDRISVGALTHSAVYLDVVLDWGRRLDLPTD